MLKQINLTDISSNISTMPTLSIKKEVARLNISGLQLGFGCDTISIGLSKELPWYSRVILKLIGIEYVRKD